MKKFLEKLFLLLILIALIVLSTLLAFKIKKDIKEEKAISEQIENEKIESEFYINNATNKLNEIKSIIEEQVGQNIELADAGSIAKIDIYFVTKVGENYRYIVKKQTDDGEKFEIANDSNESGKYIVSLDSLEIKDCVYTKVENYCVDKYGTITYLYN